MSYEHTENLHRKVARRRAPLLSPILLKALAELAECEELPVPTLIAVLLNEALDRRLHQGGRS